MDRRASLRFAATFALLALVTGAGAQTPPAPPQGPLTIVVPDGVGSTADAVARALAPAVGQAAGRLVAVVNRPGANEVTGTEAVAKAGPEGAMALLASGALSINAALQPALPYDAAKALTPVALVATRPYVLATATTLPLDTVQDVIAIAKANPGRLRYASAGPASASRLNAEMLKALATVQLTPVPFPDTAAALADLAAGKVQLWFGRYDDVQALAKAGKVRVVAVTGPQRFARLPDVPTMAESGVPGFDVVQWFGLFVPATTPKAMVERLQADVRRALQTPAVREKFATQLALDVAAGSADALDAVVKRDTAAWAMLARDLNLKVE